MRKPAVYGYTSTLGSEDQRRQDEQVIRDFCETHGLALVAVFYETLPNFPRATFKELAAIVSNRDRRVAHVVIPSMDHLDESHGLSLRLGFEFLTGVKLIDASKEVPAS